MYVAFILTAQHRKNFYLFGTLSLENIHEFVYNSDGENERNEEKTTIETIAISVVYNCKLGFIGKWIQ